MQTVQENKVHSYAFCPLEQCKLVCAFGVVQPVKIDCAICAGQLFLIVLLSDEMVKPAKIAEETNLTIVPPSVAVVQMIKLAQKVQPEKMHNLVKIVQTVKQSNYRKQYNCAVYRIYVNRLDQFKWSIKLKLFELTKFRTSLNG